MSIDIILFYGIKNYGNSSVQVPCLLNLYGITLRIHIVSKFVTIA